MAICECCKKEMIKANSCIKIPVIHNNKEYDRIKYGDEPEDWGANKYRCSDCGVKKGGYHHPGCDIECCPICSGQLISCGCIDKK